MSGSLKSSLLEAMNFFCIVSDYELCQTCRSQCTWSFSEWRRRVNEGQGSRKGVLCVCVCVCVCVWARMQLTFRNHRRVQLPVFANSNVFFFFCFFYSNTSTEQVNVIQHGANYFLSQMKRSGGKRGTRLAATQRGFEKCHVQTGLLLGSCMCDGLTLPPKLPEENKCSRLTKRGFPSCS